MTYNTTKRKENFYNMKINFSDVNLGERFTTPYSKRLMTCVKIATTLVDGQPRNAVILLGHDSKPAKDLGSLIQHSDIDVEVIRT